jgi:hypothetical protein
MRDLLIAGLGAAAGAAIHSIWQGWKLHRSMEQLKRDFIEAQNRPIPIHPMISIWGACPKEGCWGRAGHGGEHFEGPPPGPHGWEERDLIEAQGPPYTHTFSYGFSPDEDDFGPPTP